MLQSKIGVLFRANLRSDFSKTPFEELTLKHFQANSQNKYGDVSIIVFIDDDSKTRILKNKFIKKI